MWAGSRSLLVAAGPGDTLVGNTKMEVGEPQQYRTMGSLHFCSPAAIWRDNFDFVCSSSSNGVMYLCLIKKKEKNKHLCSRLEDKDYIKSLRPDNRNVFVASDHLWGCQDQSQASCFHSHERVLICGSINETAIITGSQNTLSLRPWLQMSPDRAYQIISPIVTTEVWRNVEAEEETWWSLKSLNWRTKM